MMCHRMAHNVRESDDELKGAVAGVSGSEAPLLHRHNTASPLED